MNTTLLAIQKLLKLWGFYFGDLDGRDSTELYAAVVALRADGDPRIVRKFQALVGADDDGDFGNLTWSAWTATRVKALPVGVTLAPDPRVVTSGACQWFVEIDGDDLVVRNGIATAFGGADDAGDDGETACGYPTKGHPDLLACSLPENVHSIASLRGSPIPRLPYGLFKDGSVNADGAFVIAMFDNGVVTPELPVIDIGPSLYTNHILDLTEAAARLRDPGATANNFSRVVSYRIPRMARFIPAA